MGNQNRKKGLRITPGSTRYKLAQLALKLLFKRDWHYISPWTHFSVSATIIMFHDGKMLLGKRKGVEQAGKLWFAGGHLDGSDKSIEEGAAREVFEESSIKIDPKKLTLENLIYLDMEPKKQYFEMADAAHVALDYVYILSDHEASQLKDSSEMVNWTFYTEEEVHKLIQAGDIAEAGIRPTISKAFEYIKQHDA